jgi:hypothetical protein
MHSLVIANGAWQLTASKEQFYHLAVSRCSCLLQEKKNASMVLLCLSRCIACYLRRNSSTADQQQLVRWVSRAVLPAVQAMAKGFLSAPEHQELMRQLCMVVAQSLPDYAINSMVLELLTLDGANWESPMAGLMALLSILLEAPARLAGRRTPVELQPTTQDMERLTSTPAWVPSATASTALLELIKQGFNPLDAYGCRGLLPRVTAAHSRVMLQCHQLYGFTRMTHTAKPVSEAAVRERLGALPVFVMALQCVPFIIPNHWSDGHIADDLPGYTIHPEPSMRQVHGAPSSVLEVVPCAPLCYMHHVAMADEDGSLSAGCHHGAAALHPVTPCCAQCVAGWHGHLHCAYSRGAC